MSKTPLVKTTGRGELGQARQQLGARAELGDEIGEHAAIVVAPAATRRLDSRHLSRSVAMIVLCGLPISNYYNKVKLALLEKGIAFRKKAFGTGSADPAVLAARRSPRSRSSAPTPARCARARRSSSTSRPRIPSRRSLPADPFAAAKVRELVTFIDLHVELVARELYPKAFFGGTISDGNAERVRKLLVRNIAALKQLARFAPYVAGPEFTQADCAAWATLPVVSMATKLVYGDDLLAAVVASTGSRTSASSASGRARKRVTEDRKAWQDRAAAGKA